MADNVTFPLTGSGDSTKVCATDEVTYSGDTAEVQLMRPVLVTGSEGSKTVVDLPGDATFGLDVDPTRNVVAATSTGSITAIDQDVSIAVLGRKSVNVLLSGTWTGTVDFQVSSDGGSTWNGAFALKFDDGLTYQEVTSNGVFAFIALGAITHARILSVAWTSGTLGISLIANECPPVPPQFLYSAFDQANAPEMFNVVGGVDTVAGAHVATMAGSAPGAGDYGFVVRDAAEKVDDNAFTPATDAVLMAGFEFDDSSPDSVNEGDAGAARMSANRNIYMRIRDNAGNERGANVDTSGNLNVIASAQPGVDIGDVTVNNASGASAVNIQDGGNTITVDGTVAVTTLKPDGTNTMPSIDVASRAGFIKITDGTLTGGLVDETGSSAVDAQAVGGGTPHDSVNSGNPLYAGGQAISHGTNPTAVASGDRTKFYANIAGIPFVIGGHPNIVTIKHTTITTAVTDAAIVTVAGGLKIVVTRITVTLDNASTVFPTLLIGFGATNTPTTTGVLVAHGGVPAGGGVNVGDGSGILGIGADGEDLRVTTTGNATGNGLQIVVSYYTIES